MKVVGMNRRLAALMFTDMVGYSALTEGNEGLSLELLEEHRSVLRNRVAEFGGREVKSTGDGLLLEFASVIDAVQCAVQVQTALYERNLTVPAERRVRIRIGIHIGDIVDSEKDCHGNGVNIAARIEPYALPGSIAITQSVVDQIRGRVNLPLKRLKALALKNIEASPAVYRMVLPWESTGRPRLARLRDFGRNWSRHFRSPAHASLGATLAGTVALTALVASFFVSERGRPGAGPQASVPLPNRWEIALRTEGEPVWRAFDPAKASELVDEVDGPYELRLRFDTEGEFRHPAMVLGLVSDRHEAYLNGKFIGGAREFSELAEYPLDGALAKSGRNELVIRAESRPTLTPGLYLLPDAPPQIGEFSEIAALVDAHRFSIDVRGSIYLVVCLLTAFASLVYAVFRRRRKYFYPAVFLFMGALAVAFYNSFVIENVGYRPYRWLNLVAFAGSALALLSFDLEIRGKKRLEALNNFLGLGFAAVSAAALLLGPIRPSAYLGRFTALFGVVAVYAGAAFVSYWRKAPNRKLSDTLVLRFFGGVVFGVAAAVFVGKAAAVGLPLPALPSWAYDVVRRVSLLSPIAFAFVSFTVAIADYVKKSLEIAYKEKKDDLMLGIASAIARSEDAAETVRDVQTRVADFLGAARSTIYLLDASGNSLRAEVVLGTPAVKGAVEPAIDVDAGIVGYCLKTQAPVWVEDIRTDERFRAELLGRAAETEPRTYRTGSFIVAPIQLGKQVFGVITIADRKDGSPFTAEDFCLVHLASRDLSVLVNQLRSAGPSRLKLVA